MDAQAEVSEIKIAEQQEMTADHLQHLLSTLNDPLEELWERNVPYEEIAAQEQQLLRKFVREQLQNKESYQNIFRTDKGSLYFTLPTGESLRVKQQGEEWKLQPICRKIFYVDEAQGERLLEMLHAFDFQEAIIGMPIQTVPCQVGATPVEFSIRHLPEIFFTEKPGEIVIKGDHTGVFASGYHQGHQIREVLK